MCAGGGGFEPRTDNKRIPPFQASCVWNRALKQWSANCGPRPNYEPLSSFEWAAAYLLLFQFYKVVVGRVIVAAYIHCSLKVGVAKSCSFGLLLHHSSIACRFLKYS